MRGIEASCFPNRPGRHTTQAQESAIACLRIMKEPSTDKGQGRTLRMTYGGPSLRRHSTPIFRINANPLLGCLCPIALVVFDQNDV
jgi:hypothetical protein